MNFLTQAAAHKDAQPETIFAASERLVQKILQVKLFTVMEFDHDRSVACRSYTNMPEVYPISGEKPLERNRWFEMVGERHQIFVANNIDEIAEIFPDHKLIQSLGCESCLNLPIVVHGVVLGTLNCLDVAGYFTPKRVTAAATLKPVGTLAILAAQHIRKIRNCKP